MAHAHHHHHGPCGHNHSHDGTVRRINLAFWINTIFALVELVGGFYTNSFAVISNSMHDFSDSISLVLALFLEKKSKTGSDTKYSYGYRRFSIASAFLTSVFLLGGSLLVIGFGIQRLMNPQPANIEGMFYLSFLGIAMNGYSLLQLRRGKTLNERVLSWHFVEDTLNWVFVLIGSLILRWQNWPWLDPLLGIALACWMLWNVRLNLFEAVKIFLQATPTQISLPEVETRLLQIFGIKNVHHLHVWSMDGESHILTAHILLAQEFSPEQMSSLKNQIKGDLAKDFTILEATLEFEWPHEVCADPAHK
jgi:cobalt-zinc-cadmium efflux system protein